MNELPIDPTRYEWRAPEQDAADDLPVTRMYRVQITRYVRIGRHLRPRTITVWASSPSPRIPGTLATPTTTTEGATTS